mgnify:CR=1 FL=1
MINLKQESLSDNEQKCILILGSKSEIAINTAYLFAKNGYNIILSCRQPKELKHHCDKINQKYSVRCYLEELDILDINQYDDFFKKLSLLPTILFCAVGKMSSTNLDLNNNGEDLSNIINTNFSSNVYFIEKFVESYVNKYSEINFSIISISSVAGERGRAKNYIYGASKSGLTQYLSGLRQKYYNKNLRVITVKPGFVKTQMIKNIETPNLLTITPEKMALIIFRSFLNKKDIVYSPYWRYIMFIVRLIPEFIFKKLKF